MLRFTQQHYLHDECILSIQKYAIEDVEKKKQLGKNYIIAINKYLHNKRTRNCIDSCKSNYMISHLFIYSRSTSSLMLKRPSTRAFVIIANFVPLIVSAQQCFRYTTEAFSLSAILMSLNMFKVQ